MHSRLRVRVQWSFSSAWSCSSHPIFPRGETWNAFFFTLCGKHRTCSFSTFFQAYFLLLLLLFSFAFSLLFFPSWLLGNIPKHQQQLFFIASRWTSEEHEITVKIFALSKLFIKREKITNYWKTSIEEQKEQCSEKHAISSLSLCEKLFNVFLVFVFCFTL